MGRVGPFDHFREKPQRMGGVYFRLGLKALMQGAGATHNVVFDLCIEGREQLPGAMPENHLRTDHQFGGRIARAGFNLGERAEADAKKVCKLGL